MKVIMVCNTEILPGKMAEYIELEKEMSKVSGGADGMPSYKRLMLMSGKGDMQHIITYILEFDSFAAMDKFAARGFAPEFMEIMNKFDSIIKTHQHDVFIETPIP
jgi:hypothetical protein